MLDTNLLVSSIFHLLGILIVNSVNNSLLSTSTVPPFFSIISFTIGSPNPLSLFLFSLVETPTWNILSIIFSSILGPLFLIFIIIKF